MRAVAALVATAVLLAANVVPVAAAGPVLIDHVSWDATSLGRTLRVYPTPLGRTYEAPDGADIAWAEVLALAPDAQSPGMRMQFDCHWYGRVFIPNKPSWNLEPWRPQVDEALMTVSQCNPGGPEV
ncbi:MULTISPECIES: DUF2599 domain-containing protein [Mycobacteroides]|jgi:hypothetical protein|uniref:DUF2599 domain-containing protein n=1 Tax=Mycobacteroides chelonae TaxID=1774 RepID=A0AB73MK57_MYCCH|nr:MULTISPECIES: DUF2599 domain-containing protein [Mycobacteroides]KRQ28408.1 hypothetical protein AOT86_08260 [Mycobacteroides sp. H072]KRQ41241.1 hypothetical protein AOT84_02395 [Mycobacteroides sp. H002]KRQ53619.1 hypothetical protein AOT85_07735 [Mycobacteroides sp. H054]KRQ69538.1 hypothetical protein AOT83_15085 [Mycobacteroides sp. H001]MBF9325336.1 DUF2599 domain-containing protein [Mycobacteroides chelonae]